MNIRFYSMKMKNKNRIMIQISCSWAGKRLQLSSGLTLDVNMWDKRKEVVKRSYNYSLEYNQYLEKLRKKLIDSFVKAQVENKDLSKDEVRKLIKDHKNPPQKEKKKSFIDEFKLFIKKRRASGKFKPGSLQKYEALKNHLKDFQDDKNIVLTFDKMDSKFADKFFIYLTQEKSQVNYTAKATVKFLKTFLFDCLENGITKNTDFIKGFSKSLANFNSENTGRAVALTENEVEAIEKLDIPGKRLSKIRDLFLIECYTGIRFSDLDNLKPENIDLENNVIKLTTIKTEAPLLIPIHKKLLSILDNYPDLDFPKYSNQKYNKYIKELCEDAGIDSMVQIVSYYGKVRKEETKLKYDLISSHTARRTFITLMLKKGVMPELIMKITGHKSRKSFEKYVKLTQREALNAINQAWEM